MLCEAITSRRDSKRFRGNYGRIAQAEQVQLQACEPAGAEQLAAWCQGLMLPPRCFFLEPHRQGLRGMRHAACVLQGQHEGVSDEAGAGAAWQLPVAGPLQQPAELRGNGTMFGGDVVLGGQLRLVSLRLELMCLGMPGTVVTNA